MLLLGTRDRQCGASVRRPYSQELRCREPRDEVLTPRRTPAVLDCWHSPKPTASRRHSIGIAPPDSRGLSSYFSARLDGLALKFQLPGCSSGLLFASRTMPIGAVHRGPKCALPVTWAGQRPRCRSAAPALRIRRWRPTAVSMARRPAQVCRPRVEDATASRGEGPRQALRRAPSARPEGTGSGPQLRSWPRCRCTESSEER